MGLKGLGLIRVWLFLASVGCSVRMLVLSVDRRVWRGFGGKGLVLDFLRYDVIGKFWV